MSDVAKPVTGAAQPQGAHAAPQETSQPAAWQFPQPVHRLDALNPVPGPGASRVPRAGPALSVPAGHRLGTVALGGHTGEEMEAVDAPRVVQPPYAPELNPVERFFRELRWAIEGRVYPDLQAKQAALEPILQAWQADPERVRQLCGWAWIRKALTKLPANTQVIQA